MPRIETYQRQITADRGPSQALAQPGYGTAEFRALAESGRAISGLGELLVQMQQVDSQRQIMDANTELSGLNKQYEDPEWLRQSVGDGTFTDEAGQAAPQIPFSELADYWEGEYKAGIDRISGKFKNVPADTVQQWKAGALMLMNRKSGAIVNKQSEMIRDAAEYSWHKQSLVESDKVAAMVGGGTPEQVVASVQMFENIVEDSGRKTYQSPSNILKVQDGINTVVGDAANILVEQSIAAGDIANAQRGYDILRAMRLVSGPEYKKLSDELPTEIGFVMAANLANTDPGMARTILDEITGALTPQQVIRKRSLMAVVAQNQYEIYAEDIRQASDIAGLKAVKAEFDKDADKDIIREGHQIQLAGLMGAKTEAIREVAAKQAEGQIYYRAFVEKYKNSDVAAELDKAVKAGVISPQRAFIIAGQVNIGNRHTESKGFVMARLAGDKSVYLGKSDDSAILSVLSDAGLITAPAAGPNGSKVKYGQAVPEKRIEMASAISAIGRVPSQMIDAIEERIISSDPAVVQDAMLDYLAIQQTSPNLANKAFVRLDPLARIRMAAIRRRAEMTGQLDEIPKDWLSDIMRLEVVDYNPQQVLNILFSGKPGSDADYGDFSRAYAVSQYTDKLRNEISTWPDAIGKTWFGGKKIIRTTATENPSADIVNDYLDAITDEFVALRGSGVSEPAAVKGAKQRATSYIAARYPHVWWHDEEVLWLNGGPPTTPETGDKIGNDFNAWAKSAKMDPELARWVKQTYRPYWSEEHKGYLLINELEPFEFASADGNVFISKGLDKFEDFSAERLQAAMTALKSPAITVKSPNKKLLETIMRQIDNGKEPWEKIVAGYSTDNFTTEEVNRLEKFLEIRGYTKGSK